jgi:hypothetical protein
MAKIIHHGDTATQRKAKAKALTTENTENTEKNARRKAKTDFWFSPFFSVFSGIEVVKKSFSHYLPLRIKVPPCRRG